MRTKVVWPLLSMLVIALLLSLLPRAHAGTLQWDTPAGIVNLNLTTTEALLGYGAVSKQTIGGFSLPVYTTPKNIMVLQLGAVAPWPIGSQATIQPYIAAGHDILKEIPYVNEFSSLHLNIFGRYIPDANPVKADVGLSFSYAFAGGTVAPETPAAPVPAP